MNPMKITTLLVLTVFCALTSVFAREPDLDSAEARVGSWKNDRGQIMTISFRGSTAIISYSKGTPDTGKMRGDGDTIEFEGSTAGGYKHSEGTLVLSPDHTRITKSQNIWAQDGPTQHLEATYHRMGGRISDSPDVSGAQDISTSSERKYEGQIGGSRAIFRLRFDDTHFSGTYTQGDKTYRVRGKIEGGRMLMDE